MVHDPFLWLEEIESEPSLSWVKKQNEETLKTWGQGMRFKELNEKALSIMNIKEKLTVGQVYRGEVYHLWRDEKNPIGVWRKTPLNTLGSNPQWQVLLDTDAYSKTVGQATFLNGTQFLEGSSRVLMSLAPDGKDANSVREWDLEKNDFVENGFSTKVSKDHMSWVDENHVLWASTEEPTHCGYTSKIYSWKRGSKPELLMQVPHSSLSVWGYSDESASSGRQIIVGHSLNWDETEIYFWVDGKLQKSGLPLTCRLWGSLYRDRVVVWLDKAWDHFSAGSVIVAHNPEQRLGFTSADFSLVFEATEKRPCQDFSVFKDGIAVFYSDNLKNKIQIWKDGTVQETEVPAGSTVSSLFTSVEKDQVFTSLQSFSEPPGWYQLEGLKWKLLQKAPSQYKSENTVSVQEWATSRDGTQVPYWVVYDKRFQFPRPALQLGYGGFMSSLFPSYSDINGSLWIEGGGIYILAQIRGGAEFGVAWHEAAKLENKQKSYDDFIAISEDLIRKGYTTAKQLAIRGRSNGGLLVGATITQRPDLYGAALIEVPLLDMIRYVELPPGSSWIEEYGDPRDPKMRDVILGYSPYQNIERHKKYPPILIRTARSDDRVHPGHARKMAAKFQSLGHTCWFLEEELGGHGSTPVKDQALQHALVFEFLIRNLNQK